MIRIVDKNAFYLRMTGKTRIGEYETTLDMNVIDSLIVNFVRRGRIPQTYTIDANNRVQAYNSGILAKGVYGVEFVGYYNGQPWRHFASELFAIVDSDGTEPDSTISNIDVFDVTIYMKLSGDGVTADFVQAMMEEHNADALAHTEIRSEIPAKTSDLNNDSGFQNAQQVSNTVQTAILASLINDAEASLVEDGGDPGLVAGISGQKIILVGKNLKGERGNGIASSTEELSDEDGGTNTHTFTDDDGNTHVIHTKNGKTGGVGPVGPQGDSALVGEGDLPLAHTIGQDNTKAMSQKGVTDEVAMLVGTITGTEINALGMSRYIYNNTWYATSGGNDGRLVNISAYKGRKISIVSNENYGAEIAFFSTDPVNNQTVPYCAGTSYVNNLNAGDTYSAVVPNDCKYLFVRHQRSYNNYTPASVNFYESLKEKVSALEAENTAIHAEISAVDAKTRVTLQEFTSQQIKATNVQWYIDGSSDKYVSTNVNNDARRLVFSEYQGKKVEIIAGSNIAVIAFLKTEPTAAGQSADYCEGTELITLTANTTTVLDIPSDCNFLYLRNLSGGQNYMPTKVIVSNQVADEVKEMSTDKPSLIYLSKDGNDDNDGKSSSTPKATFAAAMNAGGKDLKIILLSDLRETLNLSSWNGRKSHVEIMGRHGAMSRIIRGTFLADLEPYEGYDDVYTWTPAEGNSIIPPSTYTRAWLWQHEIPDASTLIPANERHPLQRGRTYRRLSTCLKRAGSLESLLSSESPCWYGDYTNNVLYLRAVAGSDVTENPIVVPSANGIAIQGGNYPITLVNMEAWYGSIVTSNNFVAKDCAARYNMYEGAWEIDNCKSVYLERCEADSNTMPGTDTGDGFNLHPTHNSGDDPLAKAGTHTLVDCWSHDNRDDGYSDHGKSEGTIIGGLYEHNGKAGLVPAYGSHDTIYNTTCQKNSRGITCLGGQTQDGGNGTQVACYGCVCTDNYYNFSSQGLQGEQVRFILNNCISRNATNTAIFAKDYAEVIVRDCTDNGSPTVKSASSGATITIDNGTVIE